MCSSFEFTPIDRYLIRGRFNWSIRLLKYERAMYVGKGDVFFLRGAILDFIIKVIDIYFSQFRMETVIWCY